MGWRTMLKKLGMTSAILFFAAVTQGQDKCRDILGWGVWDYSGTESERFDAARQYYAQFGSSTDANNANMEVGIPDVLTFKFGGAGSGSYSGEIQKLSETETYDR